MREVVPFNSADPAHVEARTQVLLDRLAGPWSDLLAAIWHPSVTPAAREHLRPLLAAYDRAATDAVRQAAK